MSPIDLTSTRHDREPVRLRQESAGLRHWLMGVLVVATGLTALLAAAMSSGAAVL